MSLKFLTVFAVAAAVLPVLTAATAEASTDKIVLSNSSSVDPETGSVNHRILNPSQEVNLTFTNLGLKLDFVNAQGGPETVQIYVEFPAKPEAANEQQEIRNDIMAKVLKTQGKVIVGQILRKVAENVATSGGHLVLLLDTSRTIGFQKNFVTMDNVTLIVPGQPAMTLAQVLFNTVGPQAENQAQEVMRRKYPKNPMGFMDGIAPAAVVGGPQGRAVMCEAMFQTAQ
ncbi:hypothetical protein BH10BDE1_BH10BDE1_01270 [soil metagenome]